jgi:hypothetical protein
MPRIKIPKKVAFKLAPNVHFYKKRPVSTAQTLYDSFTNNVEEPVNKNTFVEPVQTCESIIEPLRLNLKIHIDETDTPNSSPYDTSRLSPHTYEEILIQRFQEQEIRKASLASALENFCQSVTPYSQRTPTSVVLAPDSPYSLSPLCLSPRPDTNIEK